MNDEIKKLYAVVQQNPKMIALRTKADTQRNLQKLDKTQEYKEKYIGFINELHDANDNLIMAYYSKQLPPTIKEFEAEIRNRHKEHKSLVMFEEDFLHIIGKYKLMISPKIKAIKLKYK